MTAERRHVVLGLGNTLNRDEGLGVHALALLQEEIGARTSVEFIDGGTLGLNLLPLVEETSHLLLLDAVNAEKPPGSVVELSEEQIPLFASVRLSQHQITFQEVLGLARVRNKFPDHLHLIGVQPADLSIGVGMSDAVRDVLPDVLRRAEGVLMAWGLVTQEKGV